RKRTWMLLGLLIMILLILVPLLFHSVNAPTPNLNQKYTVPSVPHAPTNPHELVITPPNTNHPAPPIFATSAYVLDEDHETTLYAQNPFLHLPMLSTTKLMTATLAVEKGNLDQEVTISPLMQDQIDHLSADSALFGMKQGQTYTLRDLLYGLLYSSGNDAALVIADTVGGNVSNFVAEMNQKAQSLGMLDTHYVNPHGLLDDGQYSCAHDLAILGQYSLNIPTLQHISGARTYQIAAGGNHGARVLLNENQFLWWYPGTTGGKTGYDGVADFVQVMSITRNNHHLIGVVMHTNNWWTDMRDLMDYGSTDYTWTSPRDVEVSGHPVVYDNLWNYFASDTTHDTISMGAQGRYYIYTGYTVSGSILAYFDQQGGLTKFGFPMKMPALSDNTLITQQFQQGTIQCDTASQLCHLL
ncbi:MAG: D-alanyl-D-alanine carboxypeptidase family protein, partial [Ktedonobacteraceae bacterium]